MSEEDKYEIDEMDNEESSTLNENSLIQIDKDIKIQ